MLELQQPDALHQLRISPLENSRHTAGLLTGSLPASSLGGKRGSMARRVAFFVGLAALALAVLAACVPSVLGPMKLPLRRHLPFPFHSLHPPAPHPLLP